MLSEYANPSSRILVTGASGFVGSAVVARLKEEDRRVISAFRGRVSSEDIVTSPDLSPSANWRPLLGDVAVVVHTAARVHIMNDSASDPLAIFREVNVEGTLALARQAAEAGVRRFVFLSSVKVNGEITLSGKPFSEADTPSPVDAYGISKAEAEAGLRQIAQETGMEVVIIRPPLVYGPGVRANFQSMMRWLQRGVPLPFQSLENRRSLVALGNLVDLIVLCTGHPAAANRTFLVADGEDMSTPELLRRTAAALGTKARLFPMPAGILAAAASIVGKPTVAQRLCSSLQVDIGTTRRVLDWRPPLTVNQGLDQAARWFLSK